ncbi:MAG: LptF/LptG family permease [Bacteroidota bacterium]|jgi:lipopolysaccharide export system permease protein
MKKLDRYILFIFLKTFFFSVFLFALIATAIDISEKAEDLIQSKLTPGQIFNLYYIGFIPHIITLLFPVFILISVVFFTSRLAMRSEIIAMLSVGMSLKRILRPFVIGAIFFSFLLFVLNHFIIPEANQIRNDFEYRYIHNSTKGGNASHYITNLHFRIDSNTYAGIRGFDTMQNQGSGFYLFQVHEGKLQYNLRSESIQWDKQTRQWNLSNVVERKILELKEDVQYHPSYTLKFGYKPGELAFDEYVKEKLKTPELDRLIKKEEMRGSEALIPLKFERYRRDASAVSVIVMTLIAGILASRKIRGGSGFHMGLAFVIGVSFILVDKFSMVFSIKGNLHPLIAAWLPTVLFGLLTVRLYRQAPK